MGCGSSKPVAEDPAAAAPARAPASGAPAPADDKAAKSGVAARKITQYYSIGDILGKGGFGEVKTCSRKSDRKRCESGV